MDVAPLELDSGRSCVEAFVFKFPEFPSVYRIGEVGTEAFDVEVVRALSYFFIGRKGDPYFSMRDFRVMEQKVHRRHDLGHPCFVVGSEQCGTICRDKRMSCVFVQGRKIIGGEDGIVIQTQLSSVIILPNLWGDTAPGKVRCCIDVRKEADDRQIFISI